MSVEIDETVLKEEFDDSEHFDEYEEFRSVSRAAVASIILGILGLSAYYIQAMAGLLLMGLAAGVIGLISTIRFPEEVTGRRVAIIGIALCSLLFVGFTAMHTYVYYTEVPEGYERLTWRELQPPRREYDKVVSDRSLELNGERIFMEGYVMLPKARKHGLKSFILVRDIGACCFGDADPKPTHIMRVDLQGKETVDWSTRPRKLTGIFRVDPAMKEAKDVAGVYYSLEADSHK